jgi:hypothetical protein
MQQVSQAQRSMTSLMIHSVILHRAVDPAGSSRAQPDLELKNNNSLVACSGDAKTCLLRVMDGPLLLRERVPCARCALCPFPRPQLQFLGTNRSQPHRALAPAASANKKGHLTGFVQGLE